MLQMTESTLASLHLLSISDTWHKAISSGVQKSEYSEHGRSVCI
jgi:hypothetical protein